MLQSLPVIQPDSHPLLGRKPAWLKVRAPGGPNYLRLKGRLREWNLHTVCEEAHCPNIGECWEDATATFMILGDVCTRNCGYCAVTHGKPVWEDREEPERIGRAAGDLGLEHLVITSVNRDDLADGGAAHWAATIRAVRHLAPRCRVEVLIPDFQGNPSSLETVIAAGPDILNHNTETVPRLYRTVRPGARFERSLELLRRSKAAGRTTKSGIMVGLGEEWDEVLETIRQIRGAGADVLTVGQYLRPGPGHLPLLRYYTPEEFASLREYALGLGYAHVESGPLVRSSYHAEQHVPRP
jgi:lipoyl synthase